MYLCPIDTALRVHSRYFDFNCFILQQFRGRPFSADLLRPNFLRPNFLRPNFLRPNFPRPISASFLGRTSTISWPNFVSFLVSFLLQKIGVSALVCHKCLFRSFSVAASDQRGLDRRTVKVWPIDQSAKWS